MFIPVFVLAALVLGAAIGAWRAKRRGGKALEVETVNPRSAAESGPASVLDASGYVTARRIADVRASDEGKAGLNAFLTRSTPPWVTGS